MNDIVKRQRFDYIDQFRGFVGVLMLLGHSSYYLNSIWNNLDPFDPLFPNGGQFILRYIGYLCAPGFLIMAGAMVYWAYQRRVVKGVSSIKAKWHLIQRALFLVLVQMTWVNSSWGGFQAFRPWHFGVISSIGFSVLLLCLIVQTKWIIRLSIAIAILVIHPLLLEIPYDVDNIWQRILMQTFVDAGSFNKYPVLPWFSLALLGSVVATGWFQVWKSDRQRIRMSLTIAIIAILLAIIIRMLRGYGNIFSFSEFGSYSFFLDQKYPPSLYMNLWFFGAVIIGVSVFIAISRVFPKLLQIFTIPGKVPLFFYAVHLAILGIFVKRFDFFYREGGVWASLIGLLIMMLIMLPLSKWFYRIKRKSNNYIIRMI